jgi:hypothetical protein
MYELSIKNINYLAGEVRNSGITYSHLLDDLIDHVCCDVEYEMKQGLPFERAYEKVRQKIGFDGLQQIQDDTLYLIDKNYRTMKKTMRIFGVLAPILMAFGGLFKIMHWPTAGILLVLGFFFMTCFFLPSAIYISYKEISHRTRKWTHIIGFFGVFLLAVSFLFKIMHWPGAGFALLGGAFFTSFVFIPLLLVHKLKEPGSIVPKYVYVIAFIGFIAQLVGFSFKIMHWPGAGILFFCGIILFVFIALPVYVFKRYKESNNIEGSFIYIILAVVWFIMPTTLISLNLEKRILNANIETESILNHDIQLMQMHNRLLVKNLSGNAHVVKINKDANALFNDIQGIKVDVVKLVEGNHSKMIINDQNEINFYQISNVNATGICSKIMQNMKAKEIGRKIQSLRHEMVTESHLANNSEFIKETLTDSLNEEILSDYAVTISSINNLSFLQLNVLKADYALMTEMSQRPAKATIDPSLKK